MALSAVPIKLRGLYVRRLEDKDDPHLHGTRSSPKAPPLHQFKKPGSPQKSLEIAAHRQDAEPRKVERASLDIPVRAGSGGSPPARVADLLVEESSLGPHQNVLYSSSSEELGEQVTAMEVDPSLMQHESFLPAHPSAFHAEASYPGPTAADTLGGAVVASRSSSGGDGGPEGADSYLAPLQEESSRGAVAQQQ